jgi:Amt family ammonium transporter
LLNGIFGTLCVGLFGNMEIAKNVAGAKLESNGLLLGGGVAQLAIQAQGVLVVALFAFGASSAVWWFLRATMGIRVPPEAEEIGLDQSEMGMEAYPDDMPRAALLSSEP